VLHRVVREHLATMRLQCAEAGGLPRFVERDFERYLECGVLAPRWPWMSHPCAAGAAAPSGRLLAARQHLGA